MRWPSHEQSPYDRNGGCICSNGTHLEVQRGCAHQLYRNSFAYAGRTPQAEGFSQRVWRLRRRRAGVTRRQKHATAQAALQAQPISAADQGPFDPPSDMPVRPILLPAECDAGEHRRRGDLCKLAPPVFTPPPAEPAGPPIPRQLGYSLATAGGPLPDLERTEEIFQ